MQRKALREIQLKNSTPYEDYWEYEGASKYFIKAAESGNTEAHYELSLLYENGQGVEKDEKKEIYHLEDAAISCVPLGRIYLSRHELKKFK